MCPCLNFQPETSPTTTTETDGAGSSSAMSEQEGDISDANCLVAVEVGQKITEVFKCQSHTIKLG